MKTKLIMTVAAVSLLWACNNEDSDVVETIDVKTVAELQSALDKGNTTVTLTEPLTSDISFEIPNVYNEGREVTVNIPAAGHNVEVTQDGSHTRSYPAVFNLNVGQANEVYVTTPSFDVNFKGVAQKLVAATAPNTLTIAKSSTVYNLIATRGNARIYGTVNSVINTGSGKMLYALGAGSDRGAAQDHAIRDALAVSWADGLILTEGEYPVNMNVTPAGDHGVNASNFLWYFPIEKDGYQLIGDGNRDKIVVYGKEVVPNGAYHNQNMLTVWADGVTIDNITFRSKEEANKVIEVLGNDIMISNCAFLPNNKVASSDYTENAGGIMFSVGATSGTVWNNYINKGQVSFNSIMSGTFIVNDNIFDGVRNDNDWVVITTRNWNGLAVDNSTMVVNGSGNEFRNIPAYNSAAMSYAAIEMVYGKFSFTNTVLPQAGVYWKLSGNSVLTVNGQTYTAQ